MANLRATEVGKTITLATGFNMSTKTSVTISLVDSDGTTVTVADSSCHYTNFNFTCLRWIQVYLFQGERFTEFVTDCCIHKYLLN